MRIWLLSTGAVTRSVAAGPTSVLTRIADYLPLLKPRIIVLLAGYGVMSALVAGHGAVGAGRLALFALLGLMASGGAAALNHLFERETDAKMARTASRPLPSGRVTPVAAAWLGGLLIGTSVPTAWVALGWQVGLQLLLGAAIYGGLYTVILKRRTPSNIVIGGLSGSNMALAGWAVASPTLAPAAWLLALVIFFWTPPHFWGLAIVKDSEYRAAGIPMLPQRVGMAATARSMACYALATSVCSVALAPVAGLGLFYLVASILLGIGFTWLCAWLWLRPGLRLAWTAFKMSGIYLALLLVAMAVDVLLRI